MAQRVKNLPAMQETWVLFLGWEDPLEKEMTTHSSILAWRIPWMEEPTVHGVIKSQIRLYPLTWESGRHYYHPHFKEEEIEIQKR